MLFCTLTFPNNNLDTVLRYVSNQRLALTEHYWDPYISSVPNIKYGLNKPYGGRVLLSVGELELIPDVFDELPGETGYTWPPPLTMDVLFEYADEDDTDKVLLFEGTAHRRSPNEAAIIYKLYALDPIYKVRSLRIEQTLLSIFQNFADTLSYDLDADAATLASSVFVEITTSSSEILFLDILADVCEYYGYFFYINHINKTVHLVAMNLSNGPPVILTGVEYFSAKYQDALPIKSVIVGEAKVPGDFAYGQDVEMSNCCINDAFVRIGDNSGDDELWMVHKGDDFIPYDPEKLYRFTLKYRQKEGVNTIYGGFHCMSSETVSINTEGQNTYSLQHYIFSRGSDEATNDKWRIVTGYITGHDDENNSNTGEEGTTITGTVPAITAYPGTLYIRPLIIVNYNGAPGITDIAYCAIHEIEHSESDTEASNGAVVEALFEYKAEYFDPEEWEIFSGSADNVKSTAQDATDNIFDIASKPIVELRTPLTNSSIYLIGQEVSWEDKAQHKTITGTIKVREINYVINEDAVEMVARGEGVIA